MRFSERQELIWQRPEDLLQPDNLAAILSAACRSGKRVFLPLPARLPPSSTLSVRDMQREPFEGGVSGARLERVRVQVEPLSRRHTSETLTIPLIFKRMALAESWLMRSSGDTRCREVQLWRAGLLDGLPRSLLVPILAASYDEQSSEGALLLADVGAWLGTFATCFLLVPPEQQAAYLDHLAHLHAQFWNDPRLHDASLGLASPERALLLLSPESISAQRAAGDAHPYLLAAQEGWRAFFEHSLPEPARRIQRVLDYPGRFLASVASMPATLVHGDAWPPNMGFWQSQPDGTAQHARSRTILIDWALAAVGPATFDPLWLLFYWRKAVLHEALSFYLKRLARHLSRRSIRLPGYQRDMLVDLAVVRTVLTCGETLGQEIIRAQDDQKRGEALRLLRDWTHWASQIIHRRTWDH
jgi:hypothetical protein